MENNHLEIVAVDQTGANSYYTETSLIWCLPYLSAIAAMLSVNIVLLPLVRLLDRRVPTRLLTNTLHKDRDTLSITLVGIPHSGHQDTTPKSRLIAEWL